MKSGLPPAFSVGNVAVVTGSRSGIGLAAAERFAALGMKVALADLPGPELDAAATRVAARAIAGAVDVLALPTDVSRPGDLLRLRDTTLEKLGPISVLMNNAGVGHNPGQPWENVADWKALFEVNLWGVVHGVEAIVPDLVASERPGVVINTGSKQGITSPPGNAAYNMSKAALRNYTESLAHALREAVGSRVTAHLLIPGFTFTGMTGRTEKPPEAWSPEQVIDFLLESLGRGDFYVLCPDNAVDRQTDELRMQWAIDDLIKNRPALSRWHPEYQAEFAAFLADRLKRSGA
jgi:NAD(P)-dependent dehydrogenase (short-subunit alcohol dehydrogenase family)